MNSPFSRPVLFYDGNCPLCSKEIAIMRSRSKGAIELVNAHSVDRKTLGDLSLERRALLAQLHLLMPNGKIMIGLDANIAAWELAGGHRWLKIFTWPGIYLIAKIGYFIWAKRRFSRLYCNASGCEKFGTQT